MQAALAAMMQLELPHVNVLTKMDLLKHSSADVEQCVYGVAQGHSLQLTATHLNNCGAPGFSNQTRNISLKRCSAT